MQTPITPPPQTTTRLGVSMAGDGDEEHRIKDEMDLRRRKGKCVGEARRSQLDSGVDISNIFFFV